MTGAEAPEAELSGTQRIELDLTGLSCGACARRVENALNKIDGVRASVDFGTRVATIEADRDVSVSDLCDAVQNAGYGAKQRFGATAESDQPVLRQKPSLQRTVIDHVALLARWLISPLHR